MFFPSRFLIFVRVKPIRLHALRRPTIVVANQSALAIFLKKKLCPLAFIVTAEPWPLMTDKIRQRVIIILEREHEQETNGRTDGRDGIGNDNPCAVGSVAASLCVAAHGI